MGKTVGRTKERAVGGSGSNGTRVLCTYHNPVSQVMNHIDRAATAVCTINVPRPPRRRQSAKCTTFRKISSKNGLFFGWKPPPPRLDVLSTGFFRARERALSALQTARKGPRPGTEGARAKPHAGPPRMARHGGPRARRPQAAEPPAGHAKRSPARRRAADRQADGKDGEGRRGGDPQHRGGRAAGGGAGRGAAQAAAHTRPRPQRPALNPAVPQAAHGAAGGRHQATRPPRQGPTPQAARGAGGR